MQLRDLSHRIRTGMPVYPGDPEVRVERALSLDRDGVDVSALRLGSHTGTHVDAPSHTVAGGRTMAQVRLEELVGEALVVHVRSASGLEADAAAASDADASASGDADADDADRDAPPLPPRSVMGLADVERALGRPLPERLPRIVIVDTGWARRFGEADALAHPSLDAGLARLLVDRGMRVLGVDALSPDPSEAPAAPGRPAGDPAPPAAPGPALPVHEVVLGADGLLVENLRGLDGLPERVGVGFLPLAIDGDGAPVRAVAWIPTRDDEEREGGTEGAALRPGC